MPQLGQLVEQCHDLLATAAVQSPRRLVGQNDAAAIHQCPGDGDTLLLATGKLVRPVIQPVAQSKPRQ
ncbi:hypothetical protein D9M68_752820 [compost metagenome]